MRYNFVRVAGEIDEKLKFFGRQLELVATDKSRMRVQIDAKVAIFDHSSNSFFLGSAPQIRADSREEFIYAKRFGHVIVSAGVEGLHFGALLAFHREHDDRSVRFEAKAATDFESVHYRHGEVRDHQVGRPVAGDLQGGFSVVSDTQIVAVSIERRAQHAGDLGLVVNHEDAPVIWGLHLASWVTMCTSIGGACRKNF